MYLYLCSQDHLPQNPRRQFQASDHMGPVRHSIMNVVMSYRTPFPTRRSDHIFDHSVWLWLLSLKSRQDLPGCTMIRRCGQNSAELLLWVLGVGG